METIGKVFERAERAEARVKELEARIKELEEENEALHNKDNHE